MYSYKNVWLYALCPQIPPLHHTLTSSFSPTMPTRVPASSLQSTSTHLHSPPLMPPVLHCMCTDSKVLKSLETSPGHWLLEVCFTWSLPGAHQILVHVTLSTILPGDVGDCSMLECFCQCPKLLYSLPVSSFLDTVK